MTVSAPGVGTFVAGDLAPLQKAGGGREAGGPGGLRKADVDRSFAMMVGLRGDGMPRRSDIQPPDRDRILSALDQLRDIPSLGALTQDFVRVSRQADIPLDEVADAVGRDPALCVLILRMANSVYFSPEEKAEDLKTAVQRLGLEPLGRISRAITVLRASTQLVDGFDWRHLWIHSFATAVLAEELDGQLGTCCGDGLYPAALVHDIGKIALSTVDPAGYREVISAVWGGRGRLEEMERAYFGVDHLEAGARYAARNRMPALAVDVIAHHANPEAAASHAVETSLVSLANHLSKAHGLGFSGSVSISEDPEFEELPGWLVIEAALGRAVERQALAERMIPFIRSVRSELGGLERAQCTDSCRCENA